MATVAFRETIAVYAGTQMPYAALYTTAPTATAPGTEVTGAPYARKAVTWTAGASDGTVTATIVFDVPAGVTVNGAGFHSALTAGNFLDGGAVVQQTFGNAGTYTLSVTWAFV